MKKVVITAHGGPEVLRLVDAPKPRPGPDQIRIAVRAAGVNAHDWRVREGQFRDSHPLHLPAGVGLDASGVVDEIGAGVTGIEVGAPVFGEGTETYAEFAVLSAWVPKPAKLPFDEAAGYASIIETALRIIAQVGARPGETLLVSGASGGVGSAVLQIARDRDISVIGTCGAANEEYVRGLGAATTTYDPGWTNRVRDLGLVDAALDLAGSGVIPELVELTGDPHRVVSIADLTAPEHGVRFSGTAGDVQSALVEAVDLHARGRLHIPVTRSYPLSEAAQAQVDSRAGHTRGRRIITP